MLLAFTVQNFKSIRDPQTLRMEATSDNHLELTNLIPLGNRKLVRTAAIYGANGSGKSNFLEAMAWFRRFILESSRESQLAEEIPVRQFRLSTETESAPCHFELEFHLAGYDYRYGFQVSRTEVLAEWLFRKSPTAKQAKFFTREGADISISPKFFHDAKGLEPRTRPNSLFLSVCGQFNVKEAVEIVHWFSRFQQISGLEDRSFFPFTAHRLQTPAHQQQMLEFAQKADFNVRGLHGMVEKLPGKKEEPSAAGHGQRIAGMIVEIKTSHVKLDADQREVGEVEFDLEEDESEGTRKFVALSGPLLDTLERGSVLVVDELEARLHPLLTQAIIELFQSTANKNHAQLIFATHDVQLLEPERFRRDQVWFCEKSEAGATELYTMADFDSTIVRPNSRFSRQYLQGLFGAVPKLANLKPSSDHGSK